MAGHYKIFLILEDIYNVFPWRETSSATRSRLALRGTGVSWEARRSEINNINPILGVVCVIICGKLAFRKESIVIDLHRSILVYA